MKRGSGALLMILIILSGSIFGTIIGGALAPYLPILNYGEKIGFGPTHIDLSIFNFTIGFEASLTVAGIIGILIAIFIYRKLR